MPTSTYEAVEAKKKKGVEMLDRFGKSDEADDLAAESVESYAARKNITITNPRTVQRNPRPKSSRVGADALVRSTGRGRPAKAKTGRGRPVPHKRRNPDELGESSQMFESFHGRRPTDILDIKQRQKDRSVLAGLGKLLFLRLADGFVMEWTDRDKVMLCSDGHGNQLFIEGGDQDARPHLEAMGIEDTTKDLLDLGEIVKIAYTTDKEFDNFEQIDYVHDFGEESGVFPRLVFDQVNTQLYIVGGEYSVKPEGIVN